MLPAHQRLTPSVLIKDTIRRGRRARRGCVVAHVMTPPYRDSQGEESISTARAAFAVGRSVGNSVERHRVVRRLRSVTSPILTQLPPGTRVVLRALPEARNATTDQLAMDAQQAITKAFAGDGPMTTSEPVPHTVEHGTESPKHEPVATQGVQGWGTSPRGWRRIMWFLGWPLRGLLLALIWIYRHTISPILPPTCRYYPSCSAYAFGALQTHGAAKGSLLAGWRLLRCNPFTPGGLDPVPTHGRWRPDIEPDGTPRAKVADTP